MHLWTICSVVSLLCNDMGMTQDVKIVTDARQESNSSSPSQDGCVQLGFLPRDTAKWVAPLCDGGVCTLLARIWPKEALTIASGLSEGFVRLALHVFEVCSLSHIKAEVM